MTPDQEELLGKALYVARESALLLLRERGEVAPFALTLDAAGEIPTTFFPRDELPQASWNELFGAAVLRLQRAIAAGDVGAVALVTALESGDERGVGIQVETRAAAALLVYPTRGAGQSGSLDEPETANELLVGPLLAR